jgi:type II secretory ATPase GspE/PulE/Tfp pilus assembly ATPase PilB-like protein
VPCHEFVSGSDPAPSINGQSIPREETVSHILSLMPEIEPDQCNGRVTRGRVAIVEYMEIDSDIRNAISSQPPIGELRWRALDAGPITMRSSANRWK